MLRLERNGFPVLIVYAVFSLTFVNVIRAQTTTLSVEPMEIRAWVGNMFIVDIVVRDVIELIGYDFRIGFYNDTIRLLNAVRPLDAFLKPMLDPINQIVIIWKLDEGGNSTYQIAHFAFSLLVPEAARTGGGVLIRLTFECVEEGTKPIVLFESTLADPDAHPIPHTALSGMITVLPLPDPNGDGIVDIFDLVIVALAFRSTPNDPNWNKLADLNNDGLVDIFDLVTVAVNFSKTV